MHLRPVLVKLMSFWVVENALSPRLNDKRACYETEMNIIYYKSPVVSTLRATRLVFTFALQCNVYWPRLLYNEMAVLRNLDTMQENNNDFYLLIILLRFLHFLHPTFFCSFHLFLSSFFSSLYSFCYLSPVFVLILHFLSSFSSLL